MMPLEQSGPACAACPYYQSVGGYSRSGGWCRLAKKDPLLRSRQEFYLPYPPWCPLLKKPANSASGLLPGF